jgi:hypothetical protein
VARAAHRVDLQVVAVYFYTFSRKGVK